MISDIKLRIVRTEDAEKLLEIYRPYVEKTAISFEYEVPSLDEFKGRIINTLKKHPYLVAEKEGEILGYAYTSDFVGRVAYDHSSEMTIYLDETKRKMGIGRKLYSAIEEICKAQNITNLYACIGYPETEDEYLTRDSVHFHSRLGYRMVGQFFQCGYKFGRWYDMVWMEKHIAPHLENQPPVRTFDQVRTIIREKYQIE